MGIYSDTGFERRVRRVEKQHRRLAHGYVSSINHDGLVIARVKRRGVSFPFRGLLLVAVGFLLFKGFLLGTVGSATYADRLARLEQGTIAERAGAWVMQPDVVSQWLGDQYRNIISAGE